MLSGFIRFHAVVFGQVFIPQKMIKIRKTAAETLLARNDLYSTLDEINEGFKRRNIQIGVVTIACIEVRVRNGRINRRGFLIIEKTVFEIVF